LVHRDRKDRKANKEFKGHKVHREFKAHKVHREFKAHKGQLVLLQLLMPQITILQLHFIQ
jgi:hypothetical protein